MDTPLFARFLPSAILAPYVECYWVLRAGQSMLAQQHMPADSRLEIIFSFSGGMERMLPDGTLDCRVTSSSYVLGGRERGYRFTSLAAPVYVAVRFKPGGFFAFSRLPVSEMLDIHTPLDLLWDANEVRELECRLEAQSAPQMQAQLLEMALIQRLDPPEHLQRILLAAAWINAQGDLRLPHVADKINLSHKHMERLFQRYVGMRPVMYSRIARFQRVIARGLNGAGLSLSAMAADAGYFDQAHFNREFKIFTGSTPTAFLASQHRYVATTLPA